jgi:ADP-ribose pyrophosphatase YjhB (NUDIX family)
MSDIRFRKDGYLFSYRVEGILINDNKILLQKPLNDDGYSLPGGHIQFGETNAETLKREYKEETGIDIIVNELKWVQEVFWKWGAEYCHQISLSYLISTKDETNIPMKYSFEGIENIGKIENKIMFYWIPIDEIGAIKTFPPNIEELLKDIKGDVKHIVRREW